MIELREVSKEFQDGSETYLALDNTNLEIHAKEFVAVIGPSGSGKSTLLTIMGALQKPTQGSITFDDEDIYELSEEERSKLRFRDIGFILQGSNLVPFLTIYEQYKFKLMKSEQGSAEPKKDEPKSDEPKKDEAKTDEAKTDESRIEEVLEMLSITDVKDKYPDEISGGERQRAAIGLAILLKPKLILADEPTASLDTEKAVQIVEILKDISKQEDSAVIMVTHDERMLEYCDRVINIVDGDVEEIDHNQVKNKESIED